MRFSCRFERACAAPVHDVYDLLIDVARWPEWLPGVRAAGWEDPGPASSREGAIRRITVSGLVMRETILIANRPHHHAYTIVSGIPVIDHRADVRISATPSGSRIVWEATFRSRIPFAGPLIWAMLRVSMPQMVTALARGAESEPT
ncbi:SRPBCC family protein [Mycobacterium ahvazicum]|uniref:SRPBCC family protein n=1 Tax=Mycobacterium ahvazicum TaxID=1964395 RepID=UPI000BB93D74